MTGLLTDSPALTATPAADERLERAVREHFQFIWRSLRRLGLYSDHVVDDAAQRVFEIAARKLASIQPGRERAFFFMTALKVAHEVRRSGRVARARFGDDAVEALTDPAPDPEQTIARARLRQALDELLDAMPLDLSTVFVLFELEGLSSVEIGKMLEVPVGTVASRLRRAREQFRARAAALEEVSAFRGAK